MQQSTHSGTAPAPASGRVQQTRNNPTSGYPGIVGRRRLRPAVLGKDGFTLIEIMIVVGIIGLLATIAVPKFARARAMSHKSLCLSNLRELDSAKQQWGLENNRVNTDTPATADLVPYLRNKLMPSCPSYGTYVLGDLSSIATCNGAGHTY